MKPKLVVYKFKLNISILNRTALLIGKASWDFISTIISYTVHTNVCYLFFDCNLTSCLIYFLI